MGEVGKKDRRCGGPDSVPERAFHMERFLAAPLVCTMCKGHCLWSEGLEKR